jgi:hypothetical protein
VILLYAYVFCNPFRAGANVNIHQKTVGRPQKPAAEAMGTLDLLILSCLAISNFVEESTFTRPEEHGVVLF